MVRVTKKLLCRLLMALLLVLGAFILFMSEKATGMRCSKEGSLAILEKLCALYAARKVSGNFCHKICSSDSRSFQYERCFNRLKGKKVMQVRLDGGRLMLKSRHAEFSEYRPLFAGILDDTDASKSSPQRSMTQEGFTTFVTDHIQSVFGTTSALTREELLRWVLPEPESTLEDLTSFQMNSFWSLLQQEEYLFFTFFKDRSFFPKIYGACGHFYVEEYVSPGAVLQQSLSHGVRERYQSAAWQPRSEAARGLLDIVKATETDFHEILHLCDVKPENFGIVDARVKAIDIDISFFDKTMEDYLEQPNCTKHEDCNFFDCHGVCNLDKKKCTRERRNNNFQAICEDIFHWTRGNSGLLRHPPPSIEEELSQLLQRCVSPHEAERVAKGSTTDTFKRLYRLLSDGTVPRPRGLQH